MLGAEWTVVSVSPVRTGGAGSPRAEPVASGKALYTRYLVSGLKSILGSCCIKIHDGVIVFALKQKSARRSCFSLYGCTVNGRHAVCCT